MTSENPRPDDSTRDEHSLGSVIAAYLREGRADRRPDRAEYLARFPELAVELESFFHEYDAFDRLASPLRDFGREIQLLDSHGLDALRPARARAFTASAPRDFGDFELGRVLGSGGMGVVYEARQRSMDRPVALKMIHGGEWASAADVQRFRNEVESIARLAHPHIVPIFEVGESQGHHYYSMPLMSGGSLAGRLDRLRGDLKAAARLMIEIAGAVDYAHQRGIIHRDLKPSNVLLDDAGRPHVSDFGLARRIGEDSSLTASDAILGSPPYMAPEQAAGRSREVTTATDVYGLGAILYTLLTGRQPFQGQSQIEILEKVRQREPDRPRSIDRRVDADLETICLKCLEKEPNRRYAGASSLADDLKRWVEGRTILARRSGPARRLAKWTLRHPTMALLATILTIGGPVAFAATFAAYRESERKRVELGEKAYQTSIALAERELFVGNADRAGELLADCPEARRGWEWRVLLQRSHRNPLSLTSPGDQALCAAFSPDGRRIAIGNHKPFIHLWDASTGRELARAETKVEDTTDVAFSPDGLRLAAVTMRGSVHVWDAQGLRRVWEVVDGHGCWAVAFSPDGRTLATAGFDKTVRIRDSATGREIRAIEAHADRVTGVSFRPDGLRLASSSDDGSVKVWDVASGALIRTIPDAASIPLRHVKYSPDGLSLAAGNDDGAVAAWDEATGREIFRKGLHLNGVNDVEFSPDGKLLASAGFDLTVRVIDPRDGRELITLRGHDANVYGVAFSPDGRQLASAGWDGQVRIWDGRPWDGVADGRARVLGKMGGIVDDLAFSEDGRQLAATGRDRFLSTFDVESGREIAVRDGENGSLRAVGFHPDGRHLATAGFGKVIRLFDLKLGKAGPSLDGHLRAVSRLAFHPGGDLLASGGEDRFLIIWDLARGELFHRLKCDEGWIGDIAFSPDGSMVAASAGNAVYVVELESRKILFKRTSDKGNVNGLDFSPDSRRLAVTGMDGKITLLRAADWSTDRVIQSPCLALMDVKFHPDGRHLASCGADRMVQVWDSQDGRLLLTLRDCVALVRRLRYSRDGRYLAATGGDRSVRVWDLRERPFAAEFAGKAGKESP